MKAESLVSYFKYLGWKRGGGGFDTLTEGRSGVQKFSKATSYGEHLDADGY